MDEGSQSVKIQPISVDEAVDVLRSTRPFGDTSADTLSEALAGACDIERAVVKAGAVLVEPKADWRYYWLVIEGEIHADRPELDGNFTLAGTAITGEGFGETPLLTGKTYSPFRISAERDSILIRFSDHDFWKLMSCCPTARKVILEDMGRRLQAYQVEALHREKLVSLGTMAAGLMHELHNPGAAAKRAASQLRENLRRLQELSLRSAGKPKTPAQIECMHNLLEQAVRGCHMPAMSSIEQSDAEEEMSEWLRSSSVENAFTVGPALVTIGFRKEELACAKDAFEAPGAFSDALNWLEALVSSVSLVCAVEESISRISDLVMAVKKFAYDERTPDRDLDIHDNLQSTLTILGHKLRVKQIAIEKKFDASPSVIRTRGAALSQVWTNLIDNAADASADRGHIEIRTWNEPANGSKTAQVAVSVTDHGSGIPADVLPRIFDPFFTTKPQGSGTGLGLEIVHRIVTQKFGGTIDVESKPGHTVFTVRLPVTSPAVAQSSTMS